MPSEESGQALNQIEWFELFKTLRAEELAKTKAQTKSLDAEVLKRREQLNQRIDELEKERNAELEYLRSLKEASEKALANRGDTKLIDEALGLIKRRSQINDLSKDFVRNEVFKKAMRHYRGSDFNPRDIDKMGEDKTFEIFAGIPAVLSSTYKFLPKLLVIADIKTNVINSDYDRRVRELKEQYNGLSAELLTRKKEILRRTATSLVEAFEQVCKELESSRNRETMDNLTVAIYQVLNNYCSGEKEIDSATLDKFGTTQITSKLESMLSEGKITENEATMVSLLIKSKSWKDTEIVPAETRREKPDEKTPERKLTLDEYLHLQGFSEDAVSTLSEKAEYDTLSKRIAQLTKLIGRECAFRLIDANPALAYDTETTFNTYLGELDDLTRKIIEIGAASNENGIFDIRKKPENFNSKEKIHSTHLRLGEYIKSQEASEESHLRQYFEGIKIQYDNLVSLIVNGFRIYGDKFIGGNHIPIRHIRNNCKLDEDSFHQVFEYMRRNSALLEHPGKTYSLNPKVGEVADPTLKTLLLKKLGKIDKDKNDNKGLRPL